MVDPNALAETLKLTFGITTLIFPMQYSMIQSGNALRLVYLSVTLLLFTLLVSAHAQTTSNCSLVGTYAQSRINAIAEDGDNLFISQYDVIFSIDASDEENLRFQDTLVWWDSSVAYDYCYGLATRGNLMYAISWYSGLIVIDISDPSHLEIVYRETSVRPMRNEGVHIWEDYLFVMSNNRVQVYSIENPERPDFIYHYNPAPFMRIPAWTGPPMAISGTNAYRLRGRDTLDFIEIQPEGNVVTVESFPTITSHAYALEVYDSLLFVGMPEPPGTYGYFVKICGISADSTLHELSSISQSWPATQLIATDEKLFVNSGEYMELHVYDVSDTHNPKLSASCIFEYETLNRIHVRSNYVFVATRSSGLHVLRLDETTGVSVSQTPASLSLSPAYPNPFSGNTTITYSLPAQQQVSLEVYNTLGRKVQTLYSGIREPGSHTARFNATTLPAGTYQVVLRSGEGVKTQMVVVR